MNFYLTVYLFLVLAICGCKRVDNALPVATNNAKTKAWIAWIDQMLSDEALDNLVKRKVDKKQLIKLYGMPIGGTGPGPDGIEIVGFDFTIEYQFLRKIPGRTGIMATLKDGKLIECKPITMTVKGHP